MLYDKILNPKTNRYVRVNGRIGRQILKQYILAFYQMDKNKNALRQNGGSSELTPGSVIREKFTDVGQSAGHMVDTAKYNLDSAVQKTKETFFSLVDKMKNAFHVKKEETAKAIGGAMEKVEETAKAIGGAMEKVEGVADQVETFLGLRSSGGSSSIPNNSNSNPNPNLKTQQFIPKSREQRQLESLQSLSKSTLNEINM